MYKFRHKASVKRKNLIIPINNAKVIPYISVQHYPNFKLLNLAPTPSEVVAVSNSPKEKARSMFQL